MREVRAVYFFGTPTEWRAISGALRRARHSVTARNIDSSVSLHRDYNRQVPEVKVEATGSAIEWIWEAARETGVTIV